MVGFGGHGDVEGDNVALLHEVVEVGVGGSEGFHLVVLAAVVGEDAASEGVEEADDGGADGSGADDADGLALQFSSEEHAAALALANGAVEVGDLA